MLHLIFLFVSQFAFAQGPLDLQEADLNPSSEDVLIKKPEKYLRNESMIYDFNTDLGIKDQRRYTGADRNRFSLSGHVSGNYEHLSNLLGLEAILMRRSETYNQIWYGAQFFQANAHFDSVTQNPRGGVDPNSDTLNPRSNDETTTVQGLGLGVGHRFKLLLDFFRTEDTFENIDVFANAIQLKDGHLNKPYTGLGLTTSYGIHKRTSTSFFYGGKFTYNIASVTRSPIGDESKKERSLTLGWTSFAFEMGWFF